MHAHNLIGHSFVLTERFVGFYWFGRTDSSTCCLHLAEIKCVEFLVMP